MKLNEKTTKKYKLKDISYGAVITSVKDNSNASKAGLAEGMVILRVGQAEVKDVSVISDAVKSAKKQKRKALLMLVRTQQGNRFVAVEIK